MLLVEDEGERSVRIIRDTLEENGCNVVEAENGLTALERCADHDGPIQLLVTDMMMPGMNGHELAERIVRMRPETPVLFVSGHPEAEVGDNTLIGRRVSLLRKPFSSDELVEKVAEVVRSSDHGSLVEGLTNGFMGTPASFSTATETLIEDVGYVDRLDRLKLYPLESRVGSAAASRRLRRRCGDQSGWRGPWDGSGADGHRGLRVDPGTAG